MRRAYDVTPTTGGNLAVVYNEFGGGRYTERAAERVAHRYDVLQRRYRDQNPPSVQRDIVATVLRRLAEGPGRIPSGRTIATAIQDEEDARVDGRQ